jgi:hypothetical protein
VTPNAAGSLGLKLYVKPGCHLCDEAEADIESMRSRYPLTLECIDITADAGLTRRYWDQIPVLVVDEREYPAPLGRLVIERALSDAAAPAGSMPPELTTRPSRTGEDPAVPRRYPWSRWLGD